MDLYKVTFNGNDLHEVPGVNLHNHNFNALPARDIKINKVARRDLSIITSSEYVQKGISVYFEVCSGSRSNTENTLTVLKSLVQAQNAPLIVSQGGVDVEYTATMNEFNIEWQGVTALVEVLFIASNPIGREDNTLVLFQLTGSTTATASQTATVEGSALAYPLITVTVNAVTNGTNKHIAISNGSTNQGIRVDRTWSAADLLIIDSENMTVTVNGIITDFTGMFPQFSPGSQSLTYTDDFATRSIDLTATYEPRLV